MDCNPISRPMLEHDNVSSVARAADRKGRRFRAFGAIFIWLIAILVLGAWRLEHGLSEGSRITFRLAVEGRPVPERVAIKLNGKAFLPGERARFGKKTLLIEGPETERFETHFFVRLRDVDLGEINLTRSKGFLEIRSDPALKEITVSGPLFSTRSTNALASFTVPVGKYDVTAAYEHSTEQQNLRVRRNETVRLEFKPAVGSLNLATDPTNAEFNLSAPQLAGLNLSGNTPAQLTQLPTGVYHLRVWRGDYVKDFGVEIKHGDTNQQNVVFNYGEVKFITVQAGASVFDDAKPLGQTQTNVTELKTGQTHFQLQMEGYHPLDLYV